MKTYWRSRFGILNLYNVPPQGAAIAEANARALFDADPDLVAFSEAWHDSTRTGIYAAAPAWWRFLHEPGDSSFFGYDNRKWELIDEGFFTVHGAIASRVFGVVSDKRLLQWTILRERKTGRMVVVAVTHLAPPATKRGRVAQLAAAAARRLALRRIRLWARRRNLPVMIAADWNMPGPALSSTYVLGGRATRMSNPRSIDRLETLDGRSGIELAPSLGARVRAPHIDHPGGVLTIVYASGRAA